MIFTRYIVIHSICLNLAIQCTIYSITLGLVTYRLMPKLICLFVSCVGLGLSLISIAFWQSLVYTSLAFGVYGLFVGVMDVGAYIFLTKTARTVQYDQ